MKYTAYLFRFFLSVFLFLAVFSLINCSSSQEMPACSVTVDETSNGREITLKTGAVLCIKLQAQPSTGYLWMTGSRNIALKEIGKPRMIPGKTSKDRVLGGVEHQITHYEAVKAGSENLELHYRRPWDKKAAPAKTFKLKITVQ